MRAASWYFVFAAILGSPVWTSVLIALVPRRLSGFAYLLCGIQGLLAFGVWWFFWGGGIGGEAHLSDSWQALFGLALLPVAVLVFRFWLLRSNSELDAAPNGGPAERFDNSGVGGGPPSVS
jgi:hypothetical protein